MRAVSLFSGVGGFELGFHRAGIQTVLQVEQDPWCLSVLARHWPEVQRIDDVRKVDAGTLGRRGRHPARAGHRADAERLGPGQRRDAVNCPVDFVYGGFPCQDVSVAGKRAGLRGQRSGLWHEFQRVLSELWPRWVVIENVPGLLSSNAGRDFATLLMGLGELGYGWAYRVLDARWFGVPQRRRRVFVVGCLGDAARAAQVLAVCENCGGHPAPGRETRQDVAFTLAGGSPDTSRRIGNGWNTTYLAAATLSGGGHPESNLPGRHHEDDENLVIGSVLDDGSARPLTARSTGYRMDIESENFLVASPVRASDGHHDWSGGRGDGADNLVVADPISAHKGKTYTHEGKHNFRTHNTVFALRSDAGRDGTARTPSADAEGNVRLRDPGFNVYAESPTLDGTAPHSVGGDFGMRRLTPLECERLMGFPDEHTRWTADGKEIPDSHRYRMCGNAVVATVAEWLGHRLVLAEQWA